MPWLAMPDGLGIEIQADILGRLIGAREIRRAAAMTATHLKDPQTTQGDTAAHMLVELDVRTIRLI